MQSNKLRKERAGRSRNPCVCYTNVPPALDDTPYRDNVSTNFRHWRPGLRSEATTEASYHLTTLLCPVAANGKRLLTLIAARKPGGWRQGNACPAISLQTCDDA